VLLINRVEKFFCVLSLLSIVILVTLQIFMRYVSGSSLDWSEELTSWAFLWMAWLGFSANYTKNEHISLGGIAFLFEGGKMATILDYIIKISTIVFLSILFYLTYRTLIKPFIWRQSSVVLSLPVYILYFSVLVGCGLSVLKVAISLAPKKRVTNDL